LRKLLKNILLILLSSFTVHVNGQCSSVISTFPYQESFESGTANWITGGTNNDWAWCAPSKSVITAAGAGNKCWITGGPTASFYNYGERSWVESPCFDFTMLNRPYVSFLLFVETERTYDGGNLQFSIDGGNTWENVGAFGDVNGCNNQNWYNISNIINLNRFISNSEGWSGNIQPSGGGCSGGGGSGLWKLTSHCLKNLAHVSQVKFRFTFGSGTTCNDYDGFAFDNFFIGESPSFPDDFNQLCVNNNTVNFSDADPGCHDFWTWNFGDPQSANNSFNGDHASHQFSSGGIFSVSMTTGGECASDTLIVKQVKILSATAQVTPVSCTGDNDGVVSVSVSNPGIGIGYSWSHDANITSNTANGLTVGDYTIMVNEPGACSVSVLASVILGPNAFPKISLGDDTVICSGSQIILQPGVYSSYQWQDNSTDSFYVVKKEGVYSLKITNISGCTASDSITIKEDCIYDIIIPNAFTPNGDAVNETFLVAGSETSEFRIEIFNRWGEMIFSSTDRATGWDGSYKGHQAQEGFYNYIVDYTIGTSERFKKGSIYLFR
jgi:gliding motility-associated-like protein